MTEWKIDCGSQSLVIAAGSGLPRVVYWGTRLSLSEDLSALARAAQSDLTGGMLDRLPDLSLTPGASGDSWQGQPGLILQEADGTPLVPKLSFVRAVEGDGALALYSEGGGLRLTHRIGADAEGVIGLSTRLEADRPIRVLWLAAPVLPATQMSDDIIDVSGKWTREFHLNRTPWSFGLRVREARTGRSGHEHPPFAIVPERGATDTTGVVFGYSYAWSGGHRMVAEELPDGRRQIQFGHATGAETQPGTRFESAPLYVAMSDSGLNGLAVSWQRFTRDRIVEWPDPTRPRPVHYNCWEAIYFNHNIADLAAIADRAAEIGAERFVLDDGWFGRRDNDLSSLGDWTVDRKKWPQGLGPLIEHVHSRGMTFGLWFEPEMVNPDSDLYRAHPDWALGSADQVLGRNQMVLNLARPDVRDHLFAAVSSVLAAYDIDYVKWDHNRLLPVVDAEQTRGTYELFARLRAAHPRVEFESCASGGGRIDLGILAHTSRVWLSDCNDAVERLKMQNDAALFLPSAITGSHVGPRKSHTTGRVLTMGFRAWVAASRHMGFEMDLRELSAEEAETLKRVTAWYKSNRDWLMTGDIHRLPSSDPAVIAEQQIARDGRRFVVFAGQAATSSQILPRPLRLTALDPDALYELRLANPEDRAPQSRGPNVLKSGPIRLTGSALMGQGLNLPVMWPETVLVIEGTRI